MCFLIYFIWAPYRVRPVLAVVPLGVGLGVDGAAAVAAGTGGAQAGVAVAGGEHTPHLTICTTYSEFIMEYLFIDKHLFCSTLPSTVNGQNANI